ncbi:hypothetical protein T645_17650, partial [Klebsiella pneumoniae MRSN 6902]
QNDVTLKMPAFEWVHVQLHQQKGMISLSPPTICNSRSFQKVVDQSSPRCFIKPYGHRNQQINITVWLQAAIHCGAVQMYGQQRRFEMALDDANYL